MAMQTLTAGVYLPSMPNWGITGTTSLVTINDGLRYAGAAIRLAKSGTITDVTVRTGTVTTGVPLTVTLETINAATGLPTGTLYGGSAAGSIASPATNTSYVVTLGTPATATANDLVFIKVIASTTPVNLILGCVVNDRAPQGFPYSTTNAGVKAASVPFMTVIYDDGSYSPIFTVPALFTIQQNVSTSTTPDEMANVYVLPFPTRAYGFWAQIDLISDADVILYDSDGTTVLQSVSLDKDISGSSTELIFLDKFPSTQAMTAGHTYYLAIKPTTTTAIQLDYFTAVSAAGMNAFELGSTCTFASRVDGGAWTPDTTSRLMAGLIVDQFDDGTGTAAGGGMIVHPGMQGGCRG